ncbi:Protein of unknown function [Bacillus mycoides]|nr:Protein of unknown function [Bacillus mycoides]
MKLLSKKSWQG